MREFSPTMRVDVLVSDWRASSPPISRRNAGARSVRQGVGSLPGGRLRVRSVVLARGRPPHEQPWVGTSGRSTRILGPGKYFGFSHRKWSPPGPDRTDLPTPQGGHEHAPYRRVRPPALSGADRLPRPSERRGREGEGVARDLPRRARDRRRADPFLRHFETFRTILERATAPPGPAAAPARPRRPGPPSRPPRKKDGGPRRPRAHRSASTRTEA